MTKQPPYTNGLMTLTDDEKAAIKKQLEMIMVSFVADDFSPVCDTFYIVSRYNEQNVGNEINGDTAEFILK